MITFIKAQASAIGATVIDFVTTFLLAEFLGMPKFIAGIIGLIVGGAVNFFVNKKWVFAKHDRVFGRLAKYILVWFGNFALNAWGYRWMLYSFPHLYYLIGKLIVAAAVGIFYNYLLQRRFVFK
ncbi:MAG TPA: GtrA family protein [Arachidicoccus sp.]